MRIFVVIKKYGLYAVEAFALSALIYLAFNFSIAKDQVVVNRGGDAALFEQLTTNAFTKKTLDSNVFANLVNFLEKGYHKRSLEENFHRNLIPPASPERDVLGFHAYYVLFLIAPLLEYFTPSLSLALVQTFSFLSLLIIVYFVLRERSRKPLLALCFLPLVVLHPVFVGGLLGQFYPDRIFIPLGMLLCYQAYQHKPIRYLIITAFFTAAINERAALMGGLILLLVPFCNPENSKNRRYLFVSAVLGLLLLAYAYVQIKFVLNNFYYGSYFRGGIRSYIERYSTPEFINGLLTFSAVNLALLLLSLGNVRLLGVSLLAMMPNLIGTVGGAEKTGWMTHYHSHYFPFLVFSGAIGFLKLQTRLALLLPKFKLASYATGILVAIIPYGIAAYELDAQVRMGGIPDRTYLTYYWNIYSYYKSGLPTNMSIKQSVQDAIAPGSLVSTDELGIALVYDKVRIDVFPVAARKADYLLIPCNIIEGAASDSTNLITRKWLNEAGFDPESLTTFNAIGRCLLKRKEVRSLPAGLPTHEQ